MLKNLINRSENSQVEMKDSVLRDIIPSNDVDTITKTSKKRFLKICQLLIFMFVLGIVAFGIIILAIMLTFSGKSFMNYIINSSEGNILVLANKTQILSVHRENLTVASDEQNWRKITLNSLEDVRRSLSINKTRQEQTMESTIQTTQENKITTRDYTTIPLTTEMVLQSSTTKKKIILAKYKKLEDDHSIEDLLDS